MPTTPVNDDEDELLRRMLKLAQRLTQSQDALMLGQYRHLEGRLVALLALREAAAK